jgi:hypothetical protein
MPKSLLVFFIGAYEAKTIKKKVITFKLNFQKLPNRWAWRVRHKIIAGCHGLGIISDHELFRYGCSGAFTI